jgi:hypothetical protein
MEVQLDLFGEEYSLWSALWVQHEAGDELTRLARCRRTQFLDALADDRRFMLPAEMGLLLGEAQSSFVNGEFTATLLLVLSFVEHWLSSRVVQTRQSKAAAGHRISDLLKHLRRTGEIPLFLIESIDRLRDVRNPFTHAMPGNEYRIDLVSRRSGMSDRLFLEREARRALGLLYAVTDYMPEPWPLHDADGKEAPKPWLENPDWQVPGDLPPTHHGVFAPIMFRPKR